VSAEYAFRVAGRLTPGVLGALGPLEATAATTQTLLVGRMTDRAALYGFIARIEALGLDLMELQRLPRRPGQIGAERICPSCGHSGRTDGLDAVGQDAPSQTP
jgi:hypothetical protein